MFVRVCARARLCVCVCAYVCACAFVCVYMRARGEEQMLRTHGCVCASVCVCCGGGGGCPWRAAIRLRSIGAYPRSHACIQRAAPRGRARESVCLCVCVCVCVCVHACVRACVGACIRVCLYARACMRIMGNLTRIDTNRHGRHRAPASSARRRVRVPRKQARGHATGQRAAVAERAVRAFSRPSLSRLFAPFRGAGIRFGSQTLHCSA